jgi:hypothetical protein
MDAIPFTRYLMAGLFLGLGGLMLAWRKGPNCWIGVRLPWTYADPEIWDKSWRLAAWLLVLLGVSVLFSLAAFLIAALLAVGLCLWHPYRLYRQKYGTWRTWKDVDWLAYRPVTQCPNCGHLQELDEAGDLETTRCEACGGSLRRG